MKNYITIYVKLMMGFIGLTILSSLLIATLYYLGIINDTLSSIVALIIGFTIYFISGFYLVSQLSNRYLIHVIAVIIITAITFSFFNFTLQGISNIAMKESMLLLGSLIAIYIKKH
ncbi:MAG: hypothetical protein RR646_07540 [Erysipelotrichaceae bacterium]